jgi:hypothetical protein
MTNDQQETMQSQATATATLPTDLLGCVVSFCDGKTISTFLSIAVASDEHRPRLPAVIAAVLNRRLRAFVDCLSKMPSYMPRLMSPFVSEYASTIQQDCPASWILAVRYLSSRLAVLDYFEDAFKQSGRCGATHEWLVWSGSIHLIHSSKESGNHARFGYSESDRVESVVQVDVTSPCWYPGLTRKWSLGMQQCNVYASDYCRAFAPGGQYAPTPRSATHVARMTPIGKVNAECMDCFNKQKNRRSFANPLDHDLLNERILDRLFLVSPHDADHVSSSRMPWATGNVKACLHSVRTCPSSTLFGFWTDMASTDRMRSMTEFTADILELQQNRDRLTRNCV